MHGSLWDEAGVSLWIKRDDLAHPIVSGNKIRKLKYLIPVLQQGACSGVVSFGGAYSNHIHALAWLCRNYGLPLTIFVRAHSRASSGAISPTLRDVLDWGADVRYLSPEEYQRKTKGKGVIQWKREFPGAVIVPEGGSHWDAQFGISKMMEEITSELPDPDFWICPVGTGATAAGMVRCKKSDQWLIGVSALKSSVLDVEIGTKWNLGEYPKWMIAQQWHFGGYGLINHSLRDYLKEFDRKYSIRLDPLYNGKAMYAMEQYVKYGLIPAGSQVVFIHTGGMQGWRGFES